MFSFVPVLFCVVILFISAKPSVNSVTHTHTHTAL